MSVIDFQEAKAKREAEKEVPGHDISIQTFYVDGKFCFSLSSAESRRCNCIACVADALESVAVSMREDAEEVVWEEATPELIQETLDQLIAAGTTEDYQALIDTLIAQAHEMRAAGPSSCGNSVDESH